MTLALVFLAGCASGRSRTSGLLEQSQRIVFLGDSITYAGHYVTEIEAWLTARFENSPVVINVGLPSETVSGLSEDGHAGGRFPRPDLAERLDRVLRVTRPDLVVACYGINCGIYRPFDRDRFQKYQRGIQALVREVEDQGATLILVTPPTFDDVRSPRSFSYDAVMTRYSAWLVETFGAERVIDLHSTMKAEIARRRETQPDFTFQPDAVHPNRSGHEFIAGEIIRWFRGPAPRSGASAPLGVDPVSRETKALIVERMGIRRDAYLEAAGHTRPGIRGGLELSEAEARASELTERIRRSAGE